MTSALNSSPKDDFVVVSTDDLPHSSDEENEDNEEDEENIKLFQQQSIPMEDSMSLPDIKHPQNQLLPSTTDILSNSHEVIIPPVIHEHQNSIKAHDINDDDDIHEQLQQLTSLPSTSTSPTSKVANKLKLRILHAKNSRRRSSIDEEILDIDLAKNLNILSMDKNLNMNAIDINKISACNTPVVNGSSSLDLMVDKHISMRLTEYTGVNPFIRKPLSIYEKCKMFVLCVSGVLVARLVVAMVLLFVGYLLSVPVTICVKDFRKPLAFWRKPFQWCMYFILRMILFVFGFYWISTSTHPSLKQCCNKRKFARVIVANHNTVWDGFILLWLCKATVAAKAEIRSLPFMGRMGNALQVIWIDRNGKTGRQQAIDQIIDHAKTLELPPLIIFPQGTCTAIGTITTFKSGAFLPGIAVHPCALHWEKNYTSDLSAVGPTSTIFRELFYICTQFINHISVDFLPVYEPSIAEKLNPNTFGFNVRQKLNDNLHWTITKHSLSDFFLLKYSLEENFDTSLFLMSDINEQLLLRSKTVTKLAKKYKALDLDNDGYINYDEFCAAFDKNRNTIQMKNLFCLFNTRESILKSSNKLFSVNCENELKDNKSASDTANAATVTATAEDKLFLAAKSVKINSFDEEDDEIENNLPNNTLIISNISQLPSDGEYLSDMEMDEEFEANVNTDNSWMYHKISFDEFLVGISVCFVDDMISDACRIMFDGCNKSSTPFICKQYVVSSYQRAKYDWRLLRKQKFFKKEKYRKMKKLQKMKKSKKLQKNSGNFSSDEEDYDDIFEECDVYDMEMMRFGNIVFGGEEVNVVIGEEDGLGHEHGKHVRVPTHASMMDDDDEDEKIDFETFYEKVRKFKLEKTVQHFLQIIILIRLDITLSEEDFVDQSQVVSFKKQLFRQQSLGSTIRE